MAPRYGRKRRNREGDIVPLPSGAASGGSVKAAGDLNSIRVAVVTGVRLVREGLSQMLASQPGVALMEPASRPQPTAAASASRPHLVIADSASVRGTDLVARATEAGALVVAFGVAEDDEDEVLACAEAGVAGIVAREATVEDLVETLRTAASGDVRCSPRVTALVLRRVAKLASLRPADGKGPNLTRREWEIATFIERGLSNKEIASQLGIETATVKNHVHSLLEKLQVRRRGEVPAVLRSMGHDTLARPVRLSVPSIQGDRRELDPPSRIDPGRSIQFRTSVDPDPR
jgi:two-component system, NarL family, nitrate/nitrite response regulator NarL